MSMERTGLTPKQEKYVRNLIKGMSQRKAYRDAFESSKSWKDEVVDRRASDMLKKAEVLGRYNELQKKADSGAVLTRKRKRELLAGIAEDEGADNADRIRAIDTDNKMEGEYTNRVEITKSVDDTVKEMEAYFAGLQDTGSDI